MRTKFVTSLVALGLVAVSAAISRADVDPAVIQAGKKATAFVEIGGGTASAVCIEKPGLFVTCAHVVSTAKEGKVTLVLNAGEDDQTVVLAQVIRVDDEHDLATLKIPASSSPRPLKLGTDDPLVETLEVIGFGYPFGKNLPGAGKDGFPAVSVNLGRVTSLKRKKGKIERIQLDVVLNPGNSGGPVVDKTGRVMGIVQSGLRGAGINFAVPAGEVRTFLEAPTVTFAPPMLSIADRGKTLTWPIEVVSALDLPAGATLDVELGPAGKSKVVTARAAGDGRFLADVVPLPADPSTQSRSIRFSAEYQGGMVRGRAEDATIKVGSREVRLGDLASLELGANPNATTATGEPIRGVIAGLGATDVDLGGLAIKLDLTKAQRLLIEPSSTVPDQIACAVTLRSGTKTLSRIERVLEVSGGRPTESFSGLPMDTARIERKLPGKVSSAVVGGGGRYFLLSLKEVRKLAVFDCAQAEIRYLPLPSDNMMVAAGLETLVLVDPDQKIIQTYKLATLARTATKVLPGKDSIENVCLGSESKGPLLVVRDHKAPNRIAATTVCFLDVETLKPIRDLRPSGNGNGAFPPGVTEGEMVLPQITFGLERSAIRVSADGRVFGACRYGSSPSGLIVFNLNGRTVDAKYEHTSVGPVVPGPDGQLLYTGSGGIFDTELKPVQQQLPTGLIYLPSTDPNFFLSLSGLPGGGYVPPNQNKTPETPVAQVFLTGSSSPLLKDLSLDELRTLAKASPSNNPMALTNDQRIQFVPSASLLLTIPAENDRLVLRRVNILESLKASGADYLYVTSKPSRVAFRRQPYSYQVVAESRRGGLKFELLGAPKGMTISPSGLLTWNVPADFDEEDPSILINVSDASGQERFHTVRLMVR